MPNPARLLPCAFAACLLCLDASADPGSTFRPGARVAGVTTQSAPMPTTNSSGRITDVQSSLRKVQKEGEARPDRQLPLNSPYSGPLIGTRIGEPIGTKPQIEQQPMKEESPAQQRFVEGLFGGDGGRADARQAIRRDSAGMKKAADQTKVGQAGIDPMLQELQGAQGEPQKPKSTVKPCNPGLDCGYSRVSPR